MDDFATHFVVLCNYQAAQFTCNSMCNQKLCAAPTIWRRWTRFNHLYHILFESLLLSYHVTYISTELNEERIQLTSPPPPLKSDLFCLNKHLPGVLKRYNIQEQKFQCGFWKNDVKNQMLYVPTQNTKPNRLLRYVTNVVERCVQIIQGRTSCSSTTTSMQ